MESAKLRLSALLILDSYALFTAGTDWLQSPAVAAEHFLQPLFRRVTQTSLAAELLNLEAAGLVEVKADSLVGEALSLTPRGGQVWEGIVQADWSYYVHTETAGPATAPRMLLTAVQEAGLFAASAAEGLSCAQGDVRTHRRRLSGWQAAPWKCLDAVVQDEWIVGLGAATGGDVRDPGPLERFRENFKSSLTAVLGEREGL